MIRDEVVREFRRIRRRVRHVIFHTSGKIWGPQRGGGRRGGIDSFISRQRARSNGIEKALPVIHIFFYIVFRISVNPIMIFFLSFVISSCGAFSTGIRPW